MTIYQQALAVEYRLELQDLPEPDKLVSTNSKTGQSFRSLLRFCTHRTPLCEQHCYACRGPISWTNSVAKAIAVRRWIEDHGVENSARRMAAEINYGSIFRWMDRGDFDPLTVALANRVAELRPDVAFSAFSRNLEVLQSLSSKITCIYSLDKSSQKSVPQRIPGIRFAWMKVDDIAIPENIEIIFPLNHRKSLSGDARDCSFFKDKRVKCNVCRRCY